MHSKICHWEFRLSLSERWKKWLLGPVYLYYSNKAQEGLELFTLVGWDLVNAAVSSWVPFEIQERSACCEVHHWHSPKPIFLMLRVSSAWRFRFSKASPKSKLSPHDRPESCHGGLYECLPDACLLLCVSDCDAFFLHPCPRAACQTGFRLFCALSLDEKILMLSVGTSLIIIGALVTVSLRCWEGSRAEYLFHRFFLPLFLSAVCCWVPR